MSDERIHGETTTAGAPGWWSATGEAPEVLVGRVGDYAGPDLAKPRWVCIEAGRPGRWVRVPDDVWPLDVDAIEARMRGLDLSKRANVIQLDADVAALLDEVRTLRKLVEGR